jgi:two-component sensor histidine kinase
LGFGGKWSVARIVGIYAVFGAAWILFSDEALFAMVHDPAAIAFLSLAKGWLYVLVTAALLASLIGREMGRRTALETELRSRLSEKEILLREIHHRVRNNLQVVSSMLNLEREKIETEADRSIIDDSMARIGSMAMVHERLYSVDDLGGVDMASYLKAVASETASIFHARERLDIEIETFEANLDIAAPVGILMVEAVSNAARHGAGSRIRVSLRREAETVVLEVRDGGSGFPETLRRKGGGGVGFKLMEALALQLQGHLDTLHDDGAVLRLSFPAPEIKRQREKLQVPDA